MSNDVLETRHPRSGTDEATLPKADARGRRIELPPSFLADLVHRPLGNSVAPSTSREAATFVDSIVTSVEQDRLVHHLSVELAEARSVAGNCWHSAEQRLDVVRQLAQREIHLNRCAAEHTQEGKDAHGLAERRHEPLPTVSFLGRALEKMQQLELQGRASAAEELIRERDAARELVVVRDGQLEHASLELAQARSVAELFRKASEDRLQVVQELEEQVEQAGVALEVAKEGRAVRVTEEPSPASPTANMLEQLHTVNFELDQARSIAILFRQAAEERLQIVQKLEQELQQRDAELEAVEERNEELQLQLSQRNAALESANEHTEQLNDARDESKLSASLDRQPDVETEGEGAKRDDVPVMSEGVVKKEEQAEPTHNGLQSSDDANLIQGPASSTSSVFPSTDGTPSRHRRHEGATRAKIRIASEGLHNLFRRVWLGHAFQILKSWTLAERNRLAVRQLQTALDKKCVSKSRKNENGKSASAQVDIVYMEGVEAGKILSGDVSSSASSATQVDPAVGIAIARASYQNPRHRLHDGTSGEKMKILLVLLCNLFYRNSLAPAFQTLTKWSATMGAVERELQAALDNESVYNNEKVEHPIMVGKSPTETQQAMIINGHEAGHTKLGDSCDDLHMTLATTTTQDSIDSASLRNDSNECSSLLTGAVSPNTRRLEKLERMVEALLSHDDNVSVKESEASRLTSIALAQNSLLQNCATSVGSLQAAAGRLETFVAGMIEVAARSPPVKAKKALAEAPKNGLARQAWKAEGDGQTQQIATCPQSHAMLAAPNVEDSVPVVVAPRMRRAQSACSIVGRPQIASGNKAGGSLTSAPEERFFTASHEVSIGAKAAQSTVSAVPRCEHLAACGVFRARLAPLLEPKARVLKAGAIGRLKTHLGKHYGSICLQSKLRSFLARQALFEAKIQK